MFHKKKIFLLSCIVFLLVIAILILLNTANSTEVTSRKVLPEEVKVLNGEHKLISKSSEFSSESFSSAQSFEITSEIEKKYDITEDESYRYYINNDNSTTIKGQYTIDTLGKGNKITFIALQGNNSALVRLQNDAKWYSSLDITYPSDSTLVLPIEIKWEPSKEEELTVFPLKHENPDFYNGANQGLIRFLIMKNDEILSSSMISKQMNINNNLIGKKGISFFPVPKWYDSTDQKIKGILIEKKMYSKTQPQKLKLDALPFSTKMDLVVIDEDGKIVLVKENINLRESEVTDIALTEETIKKLNKSDRRQFVIIMNNRSRELLADMMAIRQLNKPYPTSFQLVIEYFKK